MGFEGSTIDNDRTEIGIHAQGTYIAMRTFRGDFGFVDDDDFYNTPLMD